MSAIIDLVFQVFMLLIFVRVILSYVNLSPYNPIVRFVYDTTEPFLAPVRRNMPMNIGMDVSPIVVWIIAIILRTLIRQIIGA